VDRTARRQRLTCHTSACFRSQAPGLVSGQLYAATGGGADQSRHVFLPPFGHRHSLLGHPVPPGDSAPLTVGLPRHHLGGGTDPSGVSTFCTH